MEYLLMLLLFPVVYPFVAKYVWHQDFSWDEFALNILIVVLLVSFVWFMGRSAQLHDTEVWNGVVHSKERDTVSCSHSYSCNCKTSRNSDGTTSESCDTCYEHMNDYDWVVHTTVGEKIIDRVDRQGASEPARFTAVKIGEPAAIEHDFDNYIKAVPQTLFNKNVSSTYQVPAYPRVFDYYRFNRVMYVNGAAASWSGVGSELNTRLNDALKSLGSSKQVNVFVVFVDKYAQDYRHAFENKWIGGKKNDVVVFMGVDGQSRTWVDVMTWALNTGNEEFQVELRDSLLLQKDLNAEKMSEIIVSKVKEKFNRPHMEKFKYLDGEVMPSDGIIALAAFLSVLGSILLSVFFKTHYIDWDRLRIYSGTRSGRYSW